MIGLRLRDIGLRADRVLLCLVKCLLRAVEAARKHRCAGQLQRRVSMERLGLGDFRREAGDLLVADAGIDAVARRDRLRQRRARLSDRGDEFKRR
jgi:hypothetical protein